MRKNSVRLIEVAEAAGVSRAAAGKILNGCKGDIRVSDKTRQRIMEVASRLNYHNNLLAATLAGRKSRLVGVLVEAQAVYYNQRLLQELEQTASERGLRLMVSYVHDNIQYMEENRRELESYGCLGIICLAHDYYQFASKVRRIFRNPRNIVFFLKPFFPGASYVEMEKCTALTQLIHDWKSQGRQRIACVHGNPRANTENLLLRNFQTALMANGLPLRKELFCEVPNVSDVQTRGETILRHLIERHHPDAVFCDDASEVTWLQIRLQLRGVRIPEEIVFYGGTEDPLYGWLSPAVHSLDFNYHGIATALLDALLDGAKPGSRAVIPARYHSELTQN